MSLFRALGSAPGPVPVSTAERRSVPPQPEPSPKRSASDLETLLAAADETGAILRVTGDGIRISPTSVAHLPLPDRTRLDDLLSEALPALRAELHALGAWTGDISPTAAAQTRVLLERAKATPVLVRTPAAVRRMLASLAQHPAHELVGMDIETRAAEGRPAYDLRIAKSGKPRVLKDQPDPADGGVLDPFRAKVRTVQLYWHTKEVYVVDLEHVDPTALAPVWSRPLAIHNAAFELRMLRAALGIDLPHVVDTMLGAGLVFRGERFWKLEGNRRPSLAMATLEAFGLEVPKEGARSDWSRAELSADQVAYAALDAVLAWHLANRIKTVLDDLPTGDRVRAAWHRANRALHASVDIELHGVAVDCQVHAPLIAAWTRQEATLAYRIQSELGIRPGSREVVGWLRRHLPAEERRTWPTTKTGQLSTKGKHLRRLVGKVAGAELLADFAQVRSYNANFGSGMVARIHPRTGRLHTRFNLCKAKSGRASSSEPNLQNIPSDPRMRAVFVAPKGRRLVGGDFSQLELRVLAWITQDECLRRLFRDGLDAHSTVAAGMLGIPVEALDPDNNPEHKLSRKKAKALNFGIAYGAQAQGIQAIARDQHGVVMTVAEAEHYRETWLRQYPQVARWQEQQITQTQHTRVVRTVGGRQYLFDWEAFCSYRATLAVNLPVQGTAADIAMETMVLIRKRLATLPAELILQVHDEFLLECDDDPAVVEQVKAVLERAMVEGFLALLPDAPTVGLCDIADGANWAEVH